MLSRGGARGLQETELSGLLIQRTTSVALPEPKNWLIVFL